MPDSRTITAGARYLIMFSVACAIETLILAEDCVQLSFCYCAPSCRLSSRSGQTSPIPLAAARGFVAFFAMVSREGIMPRSPGSSWGAHQLEQAAGQTTMMRRKIGANGPQGR
jgi:hypothetical protein